MCVGSTVAHAQFQILQIDDVRKRDKAGTSNG